jgi:hypothetical protein
MVIAVALALELPPFRGPEWRSLEPRNLSLLSRRNAGHLVKSDAPEAKKKNNMCDVRIDPFGAH